MLKLKSLRVVIALSIAMPLGVADTAFAAKNHEHLTYEQAWAHCKKFVDVLPKDAQSQRYSRGTCTGTATGSDLGPTGSTRPTWRSRSV